MECPGCGFKLTVDEDTLDAGSFECPECGEVIDFENAAVEEVVFGDEDDEDEKADSNCAYKQPEGSSLRLFLQRGAVPRFSSGQKAVQLPCGISQMLHDPLLLREDAFRRAEILMAYSALFPGCAKIGTPSAATPGSYIWSLSIYPSRRTAAIFSMSCDEERMNGQLRFSNTTASQ